MDKVNEYLKIDTKGKSYYSYDVNGYTFIVIGTEKRVLEKAYITKEQIDFLDKTNKAKRLCDVIADVVQPPLDVH